MERFTGYQNNRNDPKKSLWNLLKVKNSALNLGNFYKGETCKRVKNFFFSGLNKTNVVKICQFKVKKLKICQFISKLSILMFYWKFIVLQFKALVKEVD